ncbi:Ig-like domain-containing protein [Collimonas sp. OK607]|uniref:ice-binding family protein n=1 Tax=Collimonas sp. OK607 TaxID=1798194 RepID=UPI0008F1EA92|nr:ice-binding family protein [Collimonas sp. OK607]SFB24718.1 Ig-like domain-containing protein [Collimonas sp. OK607]
MNKFNSYGKCLTWLMTLLLCCLAAGCGGGGDSNGHAPVPGGSDLTPQTSRPAVTFTDPAAGAAGIAINTKILASFSKAMTPASINATTFTLAAPGAAAVAGSVMLNPTGNSATFTPTGNLAANTQFTATITTAALDAGGVALASNFVWTFTTGASADTTSPTVVSTNPADAASGVCTNKSINATFNKAIDPLTVSTATFTVTGSGAAAIAGTAAYNPAINIATFTPAASLAASATYTATIHGGSGGLKDLAGNALASDKIWTFTTGTTNCGPTGPVALGAAAPFGNLGGSAGATNAGTLTVVNGDIGSTSTTTSALTGFHDLAGDIYTETGSNKGAVNGKIYTCTVSTLGPTSAAINVQSCAIATQARSDAQTAFNNLSPAALPGGTDPGAGQLGGLTLFPGTYQAAGGSFQITGSDLTLDAQGDANAVWVFQTASTLTVGGPGAPRSVILINGAQAKNVFWQVGTSATINGAGGGTMVGTILASSAVSFSTVGNVQTVVLNGRAVGLNASVTMTNTIINVPAP